MDTSLAGLTDGSKANESTVKVGREIECSDNNSIANGTTKKGAAEKVAAVKDTTGLFNGLVIVPDTLVQLPDTQPDPDHELTQIPPIPDEVAAVIKAVSKLDANADREAAYLPYLTKDVI